MVWIKLNLHCTLARPLMQFFMQVNKMIMYGLGVFALVVPKLQVILYKELRIDHWREFKWKHHANELRYSLLKIIGIFYHISEILPVDTAIQICKGYYSFVYSRLCYAFEACGTACATICFILSRIYKKDYSSCLQRNWDVIQPISCTWTVTFQKSNAFIWIV